mgnify:CR=1 FL=1
MKDGFIRVAAATPDIHVADPQYNSEQIIELMEQGSARGVKVMVFPELCLTAYTCSDLFLQETLLKEAKNGLKCILQSSKSKDMVLFVGMPWMHKGKLYNVAAVVNRGRILGIVPKKHLPNYSEFYELRHFTPGMEKVEMTEWEGLQIPMGMKLLFSCRTMPELVLAAELCEDVWVPCPPSISHALAGATVIANCSASDETTGKDRYRYDLICGQSARLVCGYIYANAGDHLEESGSGPLKLVRAGEVAIGFGLRQQAVADKEKGLPVDYIDPEEGNFTLTESVVVVNKSEEKNAKAMEMAECIIKNGREELLKSYPIPLYEGESVPETEKSGNPKTFPEKLTVDLLKKHQELSESCKK